ncbi:hypothetical protein ACLQ2C_39865, partial [Streptomyces sp. DT73]|uniref:hypothetical protein n=1 Tax=Streptomyces sp. DT73 TaxID=3393420 RepID=UPI003CF61142
RAPHRSAGHDPWTAANDRHDALGTATHPDDRHAPGRPPAHGPAIRCGPHPHTGRRRAPHRSAGHDPWTAANDRHDALGTA